VVDMGPEGGDGGGTVIAVGTPEQIAANRTSFTGHYLKATLVGHEGRQTPAPRRKRA